CNTPTGGRAPYTSTQGAQVRPHQAQTMALAGRDALTPTRAHSESTLRPRSTAPPVTVTYDGTLRLPQATASKNQYVTSELAASCESMQWLAVYRYGVLEAMASLSNVPAQIKVAPPSGTGNFAAS